MKSIVEQIHEEFEVAQTKLILHQPNACAESLYELGFIKSKSASEYEPDSYRLREVAEYFRVEYPHYRFISEKQVENICKKYGLILTTVDRFLGEVPADKVAAMVNFKIRKKDLRHRYVEEDGYVQRHSVHWPQDNPNEMVGTRELWICAPESDIDMEGLTKVNHNAAIPVVKDPVVLQPVLEGFLIVAAWGDEASDENVVNHQMN